MIGSVRVAGSITEPMFTRYPPSSETSSTRPGWAGGDSTARGGAGGGARGAPWVAARAPASPVRAQALLAEPRDPLAGAAGEAEHGLGLRDRLFDLEHRAQRRLDEGQEPAGLDRVTGLGKG